MTFISPRRQIRPFWKKWFLDATNNMLIATLVGVRDGGLLDKSAYLIFKVVFNANLRAYLVFLNEIFNLISIILWFFKNIENPRLRKKLYFDHGASQDLDLSKLGPKWIHSDSNGKKRTVLILQGKTISNNVREYNVFDIKSQVVSFKIIVSLRTRIYN